MMRVLKFIVDGQIIKKDPNCDFGGLVPGTEGYLAAEFSFSDDWKGCRKVAAFWSAVGINEYPPQLLKDGKMCMIPPEATRESAFKVQVLGKKDGLKLTTNMITIRQYGG